MLYEEQNLGGGHRECKYCKEIIFGSVEHICDKMLRTKIVRETVYNKCNGHCAYCGIDIDIKTMQIDHIHPKVYGGSNYYYNLNPSCKYCNNYKCFYGISQLRKALNTMFNERLEYLFKSKTKMQVAINFGIVKPQKWDGLFYFEKIPQ